MPTNISGAATRLVELGWASLLKRRVGMPYQKATEIAREVITSKDHGTLEFSKGQRFDMWNSVYDFHERTKSGENDLWRGDHNKILKKETRDHKINITTTLLLTNFALSLEYLKDDKSLPFPIGNGSGTLEFPVDLGAPTSTEDANKKYIFAETAYRVSEEIMNAWSGLYERPTVLYSTPGLEWIGTARHAIAVIYENINNLDDVFQEGKLELLLEKLHERMVKNNSWGKDGNRLDRADDKGEPLPYQMLSDDMKDNYAMILAASLDGIINSKLILLKKTDES